MLDIDLVKGILKGKNEFINSKHLQPVLRERCIELKQIGTPSDTMKNWLFWGVVCPQFPTVWELNNW